MYGSIHEECGVFGVFNPKPENNIDIASTIYYGLYALQHRGQEGAGIATFNDEGQCCRHRGLGLVSKVFCPTTMEQLQGNGHLYSLDVDPIEIVKTEERLRKAGFGTDIFTPIKENFANIDLVGQEHGPFDFIMADLGVSSMQIDNPERGFSYKLDGVLDLRLNPEKGIPAYERLAQMNRDEIIGMLVENSDEPYAKEITGLILNRKKKGNPVKTTTDLRDVVFEALDFLPNNPEKKDLQKKTCQRVFQALRIDVNSEFEVLEAFLTKLPTVMKKGGRIAILTFHSGEDRLVKKAFQEYYRQGIFSEISKDVIRPSAEECRANGRARSTKLRWAVMGEYK